MISAAQAKEQTKERITQVAKEFITNEVESAIQKAISWGNFHCTVNLKGLCSPTATGAEIVSQLQDLGFVAEHVNCTLDQEGYIDIKWGED